MMNRLLLSMFVLAFVLAFVLSDTTGAPWPPAAPKLTKSTTSYLRRATLSEADEKKRVLTKIHVTDVIGGEERGGVEYLAKTETYIARLKAIVARWSLATNVHDAELQTSLLEAQSSDHTAQPNGMSNWIAKVREYFIYRRNVKRAKAMRMKGERFPALFKKGITPEHLFDALDLERLIGTKPKFSANTRSRYRQYVAYDLFYQTQIQKVN